MQPLTIPVASVLLAKMLQLVLIAHTNLVIMAVHQPVPVVRLVPAANQLLLLVAIPKKVHPVALIYVMIYMVIQNVKLIVSLFVTAVVRIPDGHSLAETTVIIKNITI